LKKYSNSLLSNALHPTLLS